MASGSLDPPPPPPSEATVPYTVPLVPFLHRSASVPGPPAPEHAAPPSGRIQPNLVMPMIGSPRRRFNPLTGAAVALVLAGVVGFLGAGDAASAPDSCAGAVPCTPALVGGGAPSASADGPGPDGTGTFCRNAGYLCAEPDRSGDVRIRRWRSFSGTLVVHVPRPEFEDPATAIELQRAAARGVRAWNNEPFPVLVDTRGDRDAHFSVRWTPTLPGTQIGLARTQWSEDDGLSVVSIELATRDPFRPERASEAHRVRLTAAHEMGHALGLPHSDSPRDVMYPTNTATSVSARDRHTMEALYRVADGARFPG